MLISASSLLFLITASQQITYYNRLKVNIIIINLSHLYIIIFIFQKKRPFESDPRQPERQGHTLKTTTNVVTSKLNKT